MTAAIDSRFQSGSPRSHGGITLTPLFPRQDPAFDYLSLEAALAQGLAVSEVGDGLVGMLRVRNPLDRAVLLYDGEELLGAKQNRIVNLSMLVGARSEAIVPVSCVERGRWDRGDRRFRTAPHLTGPELRRRKAASLRAPAADGGSVQLEVWRTVDAQLAARGVNSPTAAHADGYARRAADLGAAAESFPLESGQCGVLAQVAGKGWCLDAVSRPDVFAQVHAKLLAGYLYDADGADRSPAGANGERLLALAGSAEVERSPAETGVGVATRFVGEQVLGGGLEVDGELVAVAAYGES